jgi:hypothetical protein
MKKEIRTPQEQVLDMFIETVSDQSNFSEYHPNSMGVMRGEGKPYYTFSKKKAEDVFKDLVKLIKKHF